MVSTEPLKLVEAPQPYIRYASTEPDVVAVHRFLLVVAQPAMRGGCNVLKSLNEVVRVAKDEAALMVMHGDMLVGTMGLIRATWWYNDQEFLTDRWHFVLPAFMHSPTATLLMDEAKAIANAAGLEFLHNGKAREKGNVVRLMPRIYLPEGE